MPYVSVKYIIYINMRHVAITSKGHIFCILDHRLAFPLLRLFHRSPVRTPFFYERMLLLIIGISSFDHAKKLGLHSKSLYLHPSDRDNKTKKHTIHRQKEKRQKKCCTPPPAHTSLQRLQISCCKSSFVATAIVSFTNSSMRD